MPSNGVFVWITALLFPAPDLGHLLHSLTSHNVKSTSLLFSNKYIFSTYGAWLKRGLLCSEYPLDSKGGKGSRLKSPCRLCYAALKRIKKSIRLERVCLRQLGRVTSWKCCEVALAVQFLRRKFTIWSGLWSWPSLVSTTSQQHWQDVVFDCIIQSHSLLKSSNNDWMPLQLSSPVAAEVNSSIAVKGSVLGSARVWSGVHRWQGKHGHADCGLRSPSPPEWDVLVRSLSWEWNPSSCVCF